MGRFNSTLFAGSAAASVPTFTMQNGQMTAANPAAEHLVIGAAVVGTKPAAPAPQPAPQPAAAPVEQPANQQASSTTNHQSSNAKKREYVAPKDAIEAKQRIEAAIAKNTVIIDSKDGEDPVTFRGATYGLKDCFRMLGGAFDKDKSLWFVPRAAWLDPTTATATKSEAQQRKEQDEAKREADIQRRIQEAVEADRRLRPAATPEGMMTIDQAKQYAETAVKLTLSRLAGLPAEQVKACVEQVFSAKK